MTGLWFDRQLRHGIDREFWASTPVRHTRLDHLGLASWTRSNFPWPLAYNQDRQYTVVEVLEVTASNSEHTFKSHHYTQLYVWILYQSPLTINASSPLCYHLQVTVVATWSYSLVWLATIYASYPPFVLISPSVCNLLRLCNYLYYLRIIRQMPWQVYGLLKTVTPQSLVVLGIHVVWHFSLPNLQMSRSRQQFPFSSPFLTNTDAYVRIRMLCILGFAVFCFSELL
jgi:hypothetical protein